MFAGSVLINSVLQSVGSVDSVADSVADKLLPLMDASQ